MSNMKRTYCNRNSIHIDTHLVIFERKTIKANLKRPFIKTSKLKMVLCQFESVRTRSLLSVIRLLYFCHHHIIYITIRLEECIEAIFVGEYEHVHRFISIGLWCSHWRSRSRPRSNTPKSTRSVARGIFIISSFHIWKRTLMIFK